MAHFHFFNFSPITVVALVVFLPATVATEEQCLLQSSTKTEVQSTSKLRAKMVNEQRSMEPVGLASQSDGMSASVKQWADPIRRTSYLSELLCPTKPLAPSCMNSGQYHFDVAYDGVSMLMISNSTENKFDSIYTNSVWTHGQGGSKSGEGSSLKSTKDLCGVLHAAVAKRLSQKSSSEQSVSILDAPSGDWFWMPSCLQAIATSLPAITLKYQGVDVSGVAVGIAEQKRQGFQQNASQVQTSKFLQVNLAEPNVLLKKFGADAFDVIVCHDALQHNPHKNVNTILQNFASVGKILVVDVDRARQNDQDIPVGEFRPLDITQAPYNFSPICMNVNEAQLCDGENEWFAMFNLPLDSKHKAILGSQQTTTPGD